MTYGFDLFIDEAGDEGIERVRPIDPRGASEYFVMAGVLIRASRRAELAADLGTIKSRLGIRSGESLHFRDLNAEQQLQVCQWTGELRIGLLAVVSNKQNMRGYHNKLVEAKHFEIDRRGRKVPQRVNWFYNHMFRYLHESASAECARWSNLAFGSPRPLRVVFSRRRGFRYAQTKAYLYKLSVERHGPSYFNNKHQINWSVVSPSAIESTRSNSEPCLQLADCVASGTFRALDEDSFGSVRPELLERLAPRFIRREGQTPKGYGFKLLPAGFAGPVSVAQARALRAVGYSLPYGGPLSPVMPAELREQPETGGGF